MARPSELIRLFLCGDVMLGRGVDQRLPFPSDPTIHEDFLKDAREYVALAEAWNGPIPHRVGFDYPWGDALGELDRAAPAFRLINLETSVTTSDDDWKGKGINYRMHPGNVPCLTAAGIQCCSLANNHVLDWGYAGLLETLDALTRAGVKVVGAGRDLGEAQAPVIHDTGSGRVLVFGMGATSSGIPSEWAALEDRPGVDLLPVVSAASGRRVGERLASRRQPRDLVIASLHWGSNWNFKIASEEVDFARALVETGGADVVHGHSSHHVRGIEVYRNKLILYGCGDFLDDYEGIRGYEAFRGDLGLMYFPDLAIGSGELVSLQMVPTTVRRFRVARADEDGTAWLRDALDHWGRAFGTRTQLDAEGRLWLRW